MVDGGRGQLNVALTAARDLGLHDLSIVGLAKERESVTGEKVVDRIGVMARGRLVAQGSLPEVLATAGATSLDDAFLALTG